MMAADDPRCTVCGNGTFGAEVCGVCKRRATEDRFDELAELRTLAARLDHYAQGSHEEDPRVQLVALLLGDVAKRGNPTAHPVAPSLAERWLNEYCDEADGIEREEPKRVQVTGAELLAGLVAVFERQERLSYENAGIDPNNEPDELPHFDTDEAESYGAGVAWSEALQHVRGAIEGAEG